MEADWDVEIGGPAPVIEAHWAGFIDLRRTPERARQLPEAGQFADIADALVRLNAQSSPVWTSKCDVWNPDAFDPDELDSRPGERNCAVAFYIDLLPRDDQLWPDPLGAIAACKSICMRLRGVTLHCCRADLIVRRAFIAPDLLDLGVTAYFTACGSTPANAAATLAAALAAFVDSL